MILKLLTEPEHFFMGYIGKLFLIYNHYHHYHWHRWTPYSLNIIMGRYWLFELITKPIMFRMKVHQDSRSSVEKKGKRIQFCLFTHRYWLLGEYSQSQFQYGTTRTKFWRVCWMYSHIIYHRQRFLPFLFAHFSQLSSSQFQPYSTLNRLYWPRFSLNKYGRAWQAGVWHVCIRKIVKK